MCNRNDLPVVGSASAVRKGEGRHSKGGETGRLNNGSVHQEAPSISMRTTAETQGKVRLNIAGNHRVTFTIKSVWEWLLR